MTLTLLDSGGTRFGQLEKAGREGSTHTSLLVKLSDHKVSLKKARSEVAGGELRHLAAFIYQSPALDLLTSYFGGSFSCLSLAFSFILLFIR
jgi:hypothetical protein